jgi:hypothetical protein
MHCLIKEAEVLQNLGNHPNVINFRGVSAIYFLKIFSYVSIEITL